MSLMSRKTGQQPKAPFLTMILLFFFVVPAIPITIALLSESTDSTSVVSTLQYELTEEGKRVFQGKEELVDTYMKAAEKYEVQWQYLAAIHQVQSNFGRTTSQQGLGEDPTSSDASIDSIKVGPMGFLELNWVGTKGDSSFFDVYPDGRTPMTPRGDISNRHYPTISDPTVIERFEGMGMDGDGDGRADPLNEVDAIHSAANMMQQLGQSDNMRDILQRYNADPNFPDQVEQAALELSHTVEIQAGGSGTEQVPTGSIKSMIDHAHEIYKNDHNVGNTNKINYVWGGDSYPNFDCSSWVKYMYKKHLGIQLHRVTYDQVKQGTFVPKDQLQPGDLLFFARGSDVYHVGLYVGNGMMIHNANSRKDMEYDTINSGYYMQYYHSARRLAK